MNQQSEMMLETFKQFMEDPNAEAMYITGAAGTGKTTDTRYVVEYCLANNVSHIVAAFTHKAVGILAKKMPEKACLATLHSFLKKRPGFNQNATRPEYIDTNVQTGIPDEIAVLFVDEFSMVGEKDYQSIVERQYHPETGRLIMKAVYIGDLNQLPPVKDMQTITPGGKYWVNLTTVYRQADTNPLLDTLCQLVSFITGKAEPEPLEEHITFKRNQDIVKLYKKADDAILLAYTNERVEQLNAWIAGKKIADLGDAVLSPTTKQPYTIVRFLNPDEVYHIVSIAGDIIEAESKYRTLEVIKRLDGVGFVELEDEDGNLSHRAYVFGHNRFLQRSQILKEQAAAANKRIKSKHGDEPRNWALSNRDEPLAKERAKAWSRFIAFNSCVICLDFPYAMTVHKSQGSTFRNVFIDTKDLSKCADKDYTLYLKLMYVAISRASEMVYTN